MAKKLIITWDDEGIKGYRDILPANILTLTKSRELEHPVLDAAGSDSGYAVCVVSRVRANIECDYGNKSFRKLNEERGMEVGTMRLVLDDSGSSVREVLWRAISEKSFKSAAARARLSPVRAEDKELLEGALRRIEASFRRRSAEARDQCIDHHDRSCIVCDFNFGETYGPSAAGFIHVHHVAPLAKVRGQRAIDPIKGLRPVCPNCHAALHLDPSMSVGILKRIVERRRKGS